VKSNTRNDEARRQWVLNDEGLYLLWRHSKRAIKYWIQENREQIDEIIDNIESGKKKQHYLVYG
jgi:hypothetical protein